MPFWNSGSCCRERARLNAGSFDPADSGHGATFLCETNSGILKKVTEWCKRNGRHEETRTPDLYRVKVAL